MTDPLNYPYVPGAQGRDTSIAAAASMVGSAPRLRDWALHAITDSAGLTADEVAAKLGRSVLSVRPRVTELARVGKVKDAGIRRSNSSGRNAIVWIATE